MEKTTNVACAVQHAPHIDASVRKRLEENRVPKNIDTTGRAAKLDPALVEQWTLSRSVQRLGDAREHDVCDFEADFAGEMLVDVAKVLARRRGSNDADRRHAS